MTVQIDALLEDELNVAGAIAQAAYDRPSSCAILIINSMPWPA